MAGNVQPQLYTTLQLCKGHSQTKILGSGLLEILISINNNIHLLLKLADNHLTELSCRQIQAPVSSILIHVSQTYRPEPSPI